MDLAGYDRTLPCRSWRDSVAGVSFDLSPLIKPSRGRFSACWGRPLVWSGRESPSAASSFFLNPFRSPNEQRDSGRQDRYLPP